jgi:transcriptional regulator with XRE-family HTH domain
MATLLRHWREKRGLSLRQLADLAGVSFVTVSRIENDKLSPTVQLLEKLAKALNISVRDFFPPMAKRPRVRRRRPE